MEFAAVLAIAYLPSRADCAGKSRRTGFTLVELLVVIGIIAILAGVALGPITHAMTTAKHNAGLQTARTLALAEFQYANDNNLSYPDKSTSNSNGKGDATDVACCLLTGGYVSDPGIFVISGSSESKYTGSTTAPQNVFKQSNISWDFAGNSSLKGVNFNVPDTLPVVWSSVAPTKPTLSGTGPISVSVTSSNPYSTAGMAVCYKSNSAYFLTASGSASSAQMADSSFPGWPQATILSGGG